MAVERRWISRSPEATERLAQALGERVPAGTVVALDGDLGAGKTCFVRGLARGLGVEATIASPTYALMAQHEGRLALYHFDAWMEGRERGFLSDGGSDWLCQGGVAAVEWAARVDEHLPAARIGVRIEHVDPETRTIRVSAAGELEIQRELARIVAALPVPAGLEEIP